MGVDVSSDEPDPGLLLERILAVVDEGRRTGTHKLLTLLALIDSAQASVGPDLEPAAGVPARAVAAHVLEIVWPHVVPYAAGSEARVLSQMNDGRSNVLLDAAATARTAAEEHGVRTPEQLRQIDPAVHERAISRITTQLVRYPLPLLQRIDSSTPDFLFQGWASEQSVSRVAQEQGEPEPVVRWLPGAASALVRYAALLRPLIELEVVRDVARWNGLATEEERLRAHLFGASRTSWPEPLKQTLFDLQQGRCFYDPTGPRVSLDELEVDHFLPWRRFHHDSIENLVLARSSRNASKSDLFAAVGHVERWFETVDDRTAAAVDVGWDATPDRTLALARAGYGLLPDGAPLCAGVEGRTRRRLVEPMSDLSRRRITSILERSDGLPLAAEDRPGYE